jgi:hypothetical protein
MKAEALKGRAECRLTDACVPELQGQRDMRRLKM